MRPPRARGWSALSPKARKPPWAGNVEVVAAPDLLALLAHLKGTSILQPPQPGEAEPLGNGPDLKQVKGQEVAKRALEIAVRLGENALPDAFVERPGKRRVEKRVSVGIVEPVQHELRQPLEHVLVAA